MRNLRNPRTTTAALALALTASLGLAACGSEDDSAGASPSTTNVASTQSASEGVEPAARIVGLTGEQTSVALDQGFVDALGQLGLTPGTVGTATLADGSVAFPITGGVVSYYGPDSGVDPYVQGVVLHAGSGLSLTAGETTVELSNFVVDPGESLLFGTVTVNGEIAAQNAPVFFLDGSSLEPLQTGDGTASLTGTQVKLHPTAAELLRQTFMTDAVPDFLTIGTATITLAVPSS